jgi:uncharacterized protein with PIN domain
MPRFVCDAMLGSLARWLRFFGYDCVFPGPVDDCELAELALRDGRWLLTADRGLAAAGPRTTLVRGRDLESQLVEVFTRHDLAPEPSLEGSRCGACNGELVAVEADQVHDAVPPYVVRTATRFRRCTSCGRVYWPGTHGARILAHMERVCARIDRDAS